MLIGRDVTAANLGKGKNEEKNIKKRRKKREGKKREQKM